MVTPEVTGVWEFYRDNCPGFKEPMRKQFRRLDKYVAALEDENARLRELCADLYAEMITYSNAPNYNASVWAPKLRELGMEVDE